MDWEDCMSCSVWLCMYSLSWFGLLWVGLSVVWLCVSGVHCVVVLGVICGLVV